MNPFSDFGSIVHGARFIGRSAALRTIATRVTDAPEPSSLSIVGAPRIGKSSLAHHGIMNRRAELVSRKILPIWIDCGHLEGRDIFQIMVTEAIERLTELGGKDELLEERNRKMAGVASGPWVEMTHAACQFFRRVRDIGWRVLYILDEFDNTRKMFSKDGPGFHFLRELAYNPEWKVTYVTTSRRSIADIQGKCPISNLPGIFRPLDLSVFQPPEIDEFLSRLQQSAGVDKAVGDTLARHFAGGHPYLLDMMGAVITELAGEHALIDQASVGARIQAALAAFYDGQLLPLLREDKRLIHLLNLLFGAALDVPKEAQESLQRYGLVAGVGAGGFQGFSEHFEAFLRLVERDADVWPQWKQAETCLRDLIEQVLGSQYGARWLDVLEKAKPNLATMLQECGDRMEKEKNAFGSRASSRVLDFTYPDGLFAIIFSEWNLFKSRLAHDKNYWAQRKDLLVRVRNPLAHNRDDVLMEYERVLFAGYCAEIIECCRSGSST